MDQWIKAIEAKQITNEIRNKNSILAQERSKIAHNIRLAAEKGDNTTCYFYSEEFPKFYIESLAKELEFDGYKVIPYRKKFNSRAEAYSNDYNDRWFEISW